MEMQTEFNEKEYKEILSFTNRILKNRNITKFKPEDIVNGFYFEPNVNINEFKNLVYKKINELMPKGTAAHSFDYIPKDIKKIEITELQCKGCGSVLPISLFTFDKASNSYKTRCKKCRVIKERDLKSARKIKESKEDILTICDFMIETLNQFKKSIL